MSPRRPAYLLWGSMLMVLALLAIGVWAVEQRVSRASMVAHSAELGASFGGTDWVVWQNSDAGVVAIKVHPIILSNPNYGASYIRPGDVLVRIDHHEVYDAEVPRAIAAHAAPGTVLMYQVKRMEAGSSEHVWHNLLVPVSFAPRFSFMEYTGLWTLYPWMLLSGLFLALVSLLILFPILRPTLREHWPVLALAVFGLGLFVLLGMRHLNLLVRTEYVKVRLEQGFTFALALLLPLYGSLALLSALRGRWRLALIPVLAAGGWVAWRAWSEVYAGQLGTTGPVLEQGVHFLLLAQVAVMVLWSALSFWNGRSRIDKAFHIAALAYAAVLSANGLLALLQAGPFIGHEPATFLAHGALFIPLISAGASQLKFGRVSLVLTSSLQYVVFAAAALLLFYLLEGFLSTIGIQFRYQVYLELSLLIVLLFGLRALWKSYEGRWRQYFILAQQARRQRISAFTARIPQYTSSVRLIEDLAAALRDYFETSYVAMRLHEEEPVGDLPGLDDETQEQIHHALAAKSLHWMRNRQVGMEQLPEHLASALAATPASAAFPIAVNEHIYGMLYLGRKRRGVYNLDDIEIISRIIQQTRLTLGVLHLLEREKLLLEKNYEANLTALRSQINPHFLFNTLNTISALIHDDPDGAEKAVEKLAFIFRYTLKNSDKATVTLRDELGLVRTYLEIEQIRFGARLALDFQIDPEGLEVELPAFVVQTIVENCIKHGIARITGKGQVRIRIAREDDMVRCEIFDNGPGIDLSRVRASTGLSNSLTRMSRIYGRDDLLKFENTGSGTLVTVLLPLGRP